VESVRVVRDKTTRVGKGFAYVQFKDENAVEKALLFNGKAFPPLLPRTLRVTRAKNVTKTASYSNTSTSARSKGPVRGPTQKPSSQAQSLSGRAGKLLGRAGAAQLKKGVKTSDPGLGVKKSPEQVVFEGYRAKGGEKPALGRLKKGKVMGRSAKRGAAFKKAGGKKKRV
jgi:nucleolar protein 12